MAELLRKRNKLREELKAHIKALFPQLMNVRVSATTALRRLHIRPTIETHYTYALAQLLPLHQQKALIDKLTFGLLPVIYNDQFLKLLVLAVFEPTGRPNTCATGLRNWLLEYVYASSYEQLYTDWLRYKKEEAYAQRGAS